MQFFSKVKYHLDIFYSLVIFRGSADLNVGGFMPSIIRRLSRFVRGICNDPSTFLGVYMCDIHALGSNNLLFP